MDSVLEQVKQVVADVVYQSMTGAKSNSELIKEVGERVSWLDENGFTIKSATVNFCDGSAEIIYNQKRSEG